MAPRDDTPIINTITVIVVLHQNATPVSTLPFFTIFYFAPPC